MSSVLLLHPRHAFLDSSGTLALVDANEVHHEAALAIQKRLVIEHTRLVATNFILDETYTLLLSRLGYLHALHFLDSARKSPLRIVRVKSSDEERAEQILRQYQDKIFSYTDATSFAVMERLRSRAVFSFDRDFPQYGFSLLTP